MNKRLIDANALSQSLEDQRKALDIQPYWEFQSWVIAWINAALSTIRNAHTVETTDTVKSLISQLEFEKTAMEREVSYWQNVAEWAMKQVSMNDWNLLSEKSPEHPWKYLVELDNGLDDNFQVFNWTSKEAWEKWPVRRWKKLEASLNSK